MRVLAPIAVALIALAPTAAGAVESAPGEKPGQWAGTLGFHLGFADTLEREGDEGDAKATLGITPAIEKKLASVVAIGGEYMFYWIGPEEGDLDRRLIMSLHPRIRMSFPVYDRVTFDGLLAAGPTIWTGQDKWSEDGTRIGWSLRFAFGGSYGFNESVGAFADLGYLTSTSYGDDVELSLSSVLMTVGLRSGF